MLNGRRWRAWVVVGLAATCLMAAAVACQRELTAPSKVGVEKGPIETVGYAPTAARRLAPPSGRARADEVADLTNAGQVFSVGFEQDSHLTTFIYTLDATGNRIDHLDAYQDDEHAYGVSLEWASTGSEDYPSTVSQFVYDGDAVAASRTDYQTSTDNRWRPVVGGTLEQKIPVGHMLLNGLAARRPLALLVLVQSGSSACDTNAALGAEELILQTGLAVVAKKAGNPSAGLPTSAPSHAGNALACLVEVAKKPATELFNWSMSMTSKFAWANYSASVKAVTRAEQVWNAISNTFSDFKDADAGSCIVLFGPISCEKIQDKIKQN